MDYKKQEEIKIYKYTIHYAQIYHYNDKTYKWRPVIPLRRVYNSWIVIPLFTEKENFTILNNYFLVEELSETKKIYIDLSRQDKILISKENFDKYPKKYENQKWRKLKKSTIKLIQIKQNNFIYEDLSLLN